MTLPQDKVLNRQVAFLRCSNRISCHREEANQFRLFLHSVAHVLMHALREKCPKELNLLTLGSTRSGWVDIALSFPIVDVEPAGNGRSRGPHLIEF
jgi:hypothetical protein